VKMIRRLPVTRVIAVAAAVIVLAVAAVLLSRSREVKERPEAKSGTLDDQELSAAFSALCTSRTLVDDDLDAARDVFFTRAHATLHVMASELSNTDRPLAAELLEAKNRVEQELTGVGPQTAAEAIDRLLSISKQALISLGMNSPSCPNQAA
jgi:hypothetical protein